MKLTVNEMAKVANEICKEEKLNTDLLKVKSPLPIQESAIKNMKKINQIVEQYTGISTKNGKNLKKEDCMIKNKLGKKSCKYISESAEFDLDLLNKAKKSIHAAEIYLNSVFKTSNLNVKNYVKQISDKLSDVNIILKKLDNEITESNNKNHKIRSMMQESYLYDVIGYTYEGEIYTPEGMKAVAKEIGVPLKKLVYLGLAAPFTEEDALSFDEDIYAKNEFGKYELISKYDVISYKDDEKEEDE